MGTTGDFSTNRLERSAAVGGATWYFLGLGFAALLLSGYWDALPPPHDGRVYIGLWSFGVLLVLAGSIFGGVALTVRAGRIGLVAAVAAGGSVILYGILRSLALIGSLIWPAAVFDMVLPAIILGLVLLVMHSVRMGAGAATSVLGAAAVGVIAMAAFLLFGGPDLWIAGTIDRTALIAALGIGLAVSLFAGRAARRRGLDAAQ